MDGTRHHGSVNRLCRGVDSYMCHPFCKYIYIGIGGSFCADAAYMKYQSCMEYLYNIQSKLFLLAVGKVRRESSFGCRFLLCFFDRCQKTKSGLRHKS